jgi:flagellar L-ring protein FlgH
MKPLITNFFILFLLGALTSCSHYVSKLHSNIDRDMARQGVAGPGQLDPHFEQFRNQQQQGRAQVQGLTTSAQQRNLAPNVQRQYRPAQDSAQTSTRRRVTANDLNDNDNTGSLWVRNGAPASLFTTAPNHNQGDIVLIDVYRRLRNEITLELQRAFPPPPSSDGQTPESQAAAANETATEDDRVYDRVSTVIVEEVNRDHVLLRGRKYLIFRNRRRLVEVQALISRRDISETNSISSDDILESRIAVLR